MHRHRCGQGGILIAVCSAAVVVFTMAMIIIAQPAPTALEDRELFPSGLVALHVADPTVIEPCVLEPHVIDPRVIDASVLEPRVTVPSVPEPPGLAPLLARAQRKDLEVAAFRGDTTASGDGLEGDNGAEDIPQQRQSGPDSPQVARVTAAVDSFTRKALHLQDQQFSATERSIARQNSQASFRVYNPCFPSGGRACGSA